jgi:hypothetical protein
LSSPRNWFSSCLVEHARDWPWSSLRFPQLRDPAPIEAPTEWLQWIDQLLFDHELTTLRTCVNRQQPFGTADWQAVIATTLGLESTLRQRGRPRKSLENGLSPFLLHASIAHVRILFSIITAQPHTAEKMPLCANR